MHQIKIFTGQGQDLRAATEGAQIRANEWLEENSEEGMKVVSVTLYFPPGDRSGASVLIHYTYDE